jgi:pSer/pThr/pTyr-binding forkhead associated (FHA) protein
MLLGNEASTEYIGRNDRTLEEVFFGSSSNKNEVDQEKQTLQLTFYPPEGEPVEEIIGKFPFRIGRSYGYNDISIQDKEPYEVSRNHCCIEENSGNFFVRDLGSKLGTVVNGRRIGKGQLETSEELTRGENIIILGRDGSAYRLRLTAF